MCFSSDSKYRAPTIRESLSPGYGFNDFENIVKGNERTEDNQVKNALRPEIPDPPAVPPPPQNPRAPSTSPLRRRNAGGGMAIATNPTMLSGPGGVPASQLTLGSQTLLGGGT
jgi:hypothetical protein